MKKVLAIVAAAGVGVVLLGLAQPEKKAEAPAQTTGAPTKAGLESLGFLKGTWVGKMGSDYVEETWSGAHGDSIVGMFRWQAGGKKTTMWELLSIVNEGGTPVLRLRHFDGKFEPWKSELGPVDAMAASEVTVKRVVFAAGAESKGGLKSVEYKSPAADVLEITVTFKEEGRATLEFDLKREGK